MSGLSLRPMTAAEYAAFHRAAVAGYAEAQVAAGSWPAGDAVDRAARQFAGLLPQGAATPRTLLLTGVTADGTAVGRVWIGLDHPRGVPGCAYLHDIEVAPEHRGAGHGRALLAAAEDAARAAGADALELNVFGANTVARRLYDRAGYTVVTQQLRRALH